jgi:phosphoribosylanthranilate isomerase
MISRRVKICGLTNQQDAELAAQLGAWALGFIFYKKSPRFLAAEKASEIIQGLPSAIVKVGVFVDASIDEIVKTVLRARLTSVQLHGDETPEFCLRLKATLSAQVDPDISLLKSFRVESAESLKSINLFSNCDFYLLDSSGPDGVKGGSGKSFNWELSREIKEKNKIIIAGGLHSENVARAFALFEPFAVDVSSGVESSPGLKDEKKLRTFFASVKESQ